MAGDREEEGSREDRGSIGKGSGRVKRVCGGKVEDNGKEGELERIRGLGCKVVGTWREDGGAVCSAIVS